jgi:uncharacterized protein
MGQEQRDREYQALLQAARAGDAEAQYRLGVAYEYGEFDIHDLAEAFRWIKKAAEQGHGHAQVKLSGYYEQGISGSPDFAAAYFWAEKAALQGIVQAQNRLSTFLALGKGTNRDFEKSAYWEKEALMRGVAEGEASSMYHLGKFFREGRAGYPKDMKEAIRWYTESAELGYTTAMLTLAGIYEKGVEWPRDEQKALQWYERAGKEGIHAAKKLREIIQLKQRAEKGDADAGYQLGCLLGVYDNDGLAFFKAAVEKGHKEAARTLFEFSREMNSGHTMTTEGLAWTKRAAELGVAEAQHYMGLTVRSQDEKIAWLQKASEQGYEPAREELKKMESAPPEEPPSIGPDDMIAKLKKMADAGDPIAEMTLKSILNSPLYSQQKKE